MRRPRQDPHDPVRFVLADLFRLDPRFEKFLAIEAEGDCWLWQGATQGAGRGRRHRRGRLHRRRYRRRPTPYAPQWVYILFFGHIPEGFDVHHKCNNRLCCNPNHLDLMDAIEHRRMHGYPQ